MAKIIMFGEEARRAMQRGVDQISGYSKGNSWTKR